MQQGSPTPLGHVEALAVRGPCQRSVGVTPPARNTSMGIVIWPDWPWPLPPLTPPAPPPVPSPSPDETPVSHPDPSVSQKRPSDCLGCVAPSREEQDDPRVSGGCNEDQDSRRVDRGQDCVGYRGLRNDLYELAPIARTWGSHLSQPPCRRCLRRSRHTARN